MASRYKFPHIIEDVLVNGIRLIYVPDKTLDGLVVAFQMPYGRFCDESGFEGATELLASLIQKGPVSMSAEEFSYRFEYRGAVLSGSVGEEQTVYACRMLSKYVNELFPLFWEMICNPALCEKEFVRLKKELLTSLQAESVDPSFLASRHFYVEMAGKQHPAGRFHTQSTIKKITVEMIRDYYKFNFSPNDATLIIGGDFDPEDFSKNFIDQISGWKVQKVRAPVIAPPVELKSPVIRFIDKRDLTQTAILAGHAAPGESCEDRSAIALANYILGAGNFSSRLMTRIRSRYGKTYGISSQISGERLFGSFSISTTTQNSNVGDMVEAILKEYGEFCTEGITQEELDKAGRFAVGNISFQLEGINNVVDKLLWLRFYGHLNSYIEQFDKIIDGFDIHYINGVIKKYFSREKIVLVAVGRKSEVLAQLDTLGYPLKFFGYRDMI